ncbi:MAG: hypothetical protein GXY94_06540, partial [Bacteroidales bacterium]|nr:hypothetical protein [Bacteroidales bacterium]
PYTVEYSYTTQSKGLIHIDLWLPVEGYNVSLEEASIELITPKSLDIIFRAQNYEFELQRNELEGN